MDRPSPEWGMGVPLVGSAEKQQDEVRERDKLRSVSVTEVPVGYLSKGSVGLSGVVLCGWKDRN